MELIKGNVKVEWVFIGEGYNGDYDSNDPEDTELLRFDIYKRDNENDEWEYIEDSSHCTCFRLDTSEEKQKLGLEIIMNAVYENVINGESMKKICEKLSHIDEECILPN